MSRVRELATTVLAGIKDILYNEDGESNINIEDEAILNEANKISKKRILDLERGFSGEISSAKKGKSKDIVPTVERSKAASNRKDRKIEKSEVEKERE